jgi:hypothetical protein
MISFCFAISGLAMSRLQPGLPSFATSFSWWLPTQTSPSVSRLQPGISMMASALGRRSMAKAKSRSPAKAGSRNIIEPPQTTS